jgi:hypothetical protein
MGLGRTGDGAMGLVAVKTPSSAALLLTTSLLVGCSATPQIAAAVTGGAAGAATANPAVGFAVAVAVDAGANYAVRYYGRSRQGAEQDAIAQIAGALPNGTEATWKIEHTIPIGNEHGQLRVVRTIDSPLAACKEVAFSVDGGDAKDLKRAWFTTSICKQTEGWKWAAAEPAVERWGFLQ